jgi:hypothetical protein
MVISLSGFFQKLEFRAKHLPRAGHIPQKPPKKKSEFFEHFPMEAMRFRIYKGISEKYKGKYAIRRFVISFLLGRLNQLNSFARMLHLYCCFRRHPYQSHFRPYAYISIWPYGHMAEIWSYGHIAIWLYGIRGGRYGCFWKEQYKCSNLTKELR